MSNTKNYSRELTTSGREEIREGLDDFGHRLLHALAGGTPLTTNADDLGEWLSGATETLLPAIESAIFLGNLPDLPLAPQRHRIDCFHDLDLGVAIESSDASQAVSDLRTEADETGIELDDYEQRTVNFLERIANEAGDRVAVQDSQLDDYITDDLLSGVVLPDWLNDAIEWDKLYADVRKRWDTIDDPEGEMWFLVLRERY